jgi:hypothetical protein
LDLLSLVRKATETSAPGPSLTFTEIHVLKALELMGDEGAVGRIRLAQELHLGEGVARTLLRHLGGLELVSNTRSGSTLTKLGQKVYRSIKTQVGGPVDVPKNPITVERYNVALVVRGASKGVRYGLEQRDVAVKAGAMGATTFVLKGGTLTMPGVDEKCFKDLPEIQRSLFSGLQLREGDVVVIGSANDRVTADLSAMAAALETLKRCSRLSTRSS